MLGESRCSVLVYFGYNAVAATLQEARSMLRSQAFDLIILSATLSDEEKSRIATAAGKKARLLQLSAMTKPPALLTDVAQRLFD
jgi:DNA-binding response OmpR family regulator